MGNWGYNRYNPYKWSFFTILLTGRGAHLEGILMILDD